MNEAQGGLRGTVVLAVPARHPLAKRADIELSGLRDETLVDLPAGWGIRMAVDRSFAAAGVTRTITYEVNDPATMVEFIRNGLAIGTLRRSLIETTGDITLVPIRHHAPQFQTAIAIPASRRLSAATFAMLENDQAQHHPAAELASCAPKVHELTDRLVNALFAVTSDAITGNGPA